MHSFSSAHSWNVSRADPANMVVGVLPVRQCVLFLASGVGDGIRLRCMVARQGRGHEVFKRNYCSYGYSLVLLILLLT